MPREHMLLIGSAPKPIAEYLKVAQRVQPLHGAFDYNVTGQAVITRHASWNGRPLTALHPTLPVPSLV